MITNRKNALGPSSPIIAHCPYLLQYGLRPEAILNSSLESFIARLYESTGRAIAVTTASAPASVSTSASASALAALLKILKFLVKFIKPLIF